MADPNARLPELLRQVTAGGWRVQNLFHRMDGQCQANLRSAAESPQSFEWAYGHTFADALEAALTKARGGKTVTPRIPVGVVTEPLKVGSGSPAWDGGYTQEMTEEFTAAQNAISEQIDLEEAIAAAAPPVDEAEDMLG